MTKATGITCIIAMLLFGTLLCAEAPSSAPDATRAPASSSVADAGVADAGFAPGDTLEVNFYDFPELKGAIDVAIDPQGFIHLPYAGSVRIAGMSPSQAERAIENALISKGIEKQANVTIKVLTSSSMVVYLTGEIAHPASLPLFAPAPLAYVLNQGGGFTGVEGKHISILHRYASLPTEVAFDSENMTAKTMNTMVHPGDIIDVLPTGVFYVVGEVTKPGIYPLTGGLSLGNGISGLGRLRKMTLLEGLALSGGITSIAARSKALLIRQKADGTREIIHIDILKLEKGQIADPLLQKGDIFFVPSSYLRNLTNNFFSNVVNSLYVLPAVAGVINNP
jgi:polysaccharide export outer membrane protein